MKLEWALSLCVGLIFLSACSQTDGNGELSKSISDVTKTKVAKPSKPKVVSPFLTPGTCRTVYITSKSHDVIYSELKRQERAYGRLGGRYGIYKREDGVFIGADTMERYFENPKKYLDRQGGTTIGNKRARIKTKIARVSRGKKDYFHSTAYCSTGEEIVLDTGKRYYNPTSTNSGGLLVSVASRSIKALQEASAQASNVVAVELTSSSSTPTVSNISTTAKTQAPPALSTQQSGKSASGKTAYSIECPNGKQIRIWRADGQWYDSRGAQGGNSRSLKQQAKFLCS